jgi:hypothetical protein
VTDIEDKMFVIVTENTLSEIGAGRMLVDRRRNRSSSSSARVEMGSINPFLKSLQTTVTRYFFVSLPIGHTSSPLTLLTALKPQLPP